MKQRPVNSLISWSCITLSRLCELLDVALRIWGALRIGKKVRQTRRCDPTGLQIMLKWQKVTKTSDLKIAKFHVIGTGWALTHSGTSRKRQDPRSAFSGSVNLIFLGFFEGTNVHFRCFSYNFQAQSDVLPLRWIKYCYSALLRFSDAPEKIYRHQNHDTLHLITRWRKFGHLEAAIECERLFIANRYLAKE